MSTQEEACANENYNKEKKPGFFSLLNKKKPQEFQDVYSKNQLEYVEIGKKRNTIVSKPH